MALKLRTPMGSHTQLIETFGPESEPVTKVSADEVSVSDFLKIPPVGGQCTTTTNELRSHSKN
jgi:hypothetical protein